MKMLEVRDPGYAWCSAKSSKTRTHVCDINLVVPKKIFRVKIQSCIFRQLGKLGKPPRGRPAVTSSERQCLTPQSAPRGKFRGRSLRRQEENRVCPWRMLKGENKVADILLPSRTN